MVFKWKDGSRYSVDAQIAGDICKKLEAKGNLTATNLVDVSRPEDAPLHSCFEWDDTSAAEQFREYQARHLIRAIEVVVKSADGSEERNESVFYNIKVAGPQYMSLDAIKLDVKLFDALKDQCFRDMQSFSTKYEKVVEAQPVITAITGVLKNADKGELSNGKYYGI